MTAENLTLETRLVEPAPGLDAKPGWYLVVFEESSKGRKFLKVIPPGELFHGKWFRSQDNYSAFRVTGEPERRYTFSRGCKTRDQRHVFTLEIALSFRVSNPQAVVESREHDPLRQLQERVFESVAKRIVALPWNAIWDGGGAFQSAWQTASIDPQGQPRRLADEVNQSCAHSGLELLDLAVYRELPDDAPGPQGQRSVGTGRQLDKKRDAHPVARLELDHESELSTHRVAIQTAQDMLTGIGAGALDAGELGRRLKAVGQVLHVAPSTSPDGGRIALEPAGPEPGPLPLMTTHPATGVWKLLEELRMHFEDADPEIRRPIVSAALRRIAQVLVSEPDDEGEAEGSEEDREAESIAELDELLKWHFDQLDDPQIAWLRKLTDAKGLRDALEES